MGHISFLFSLLFFIVFAVYLFFSVYIIRLNPKAALNRSFFAVCLALGIWSFGFSLANSAPGPIACLFWRRFCALGWAPLHSILLHFLLILTGHRFLLKKRWSYLLLYLPAAVNVYIFSLSNRLSAGQYNLQYTPLGWVNVAINNGWDFFFYAYYATFSLISLALLFLWRHKNPTDRPVVLQANLTLGTLLSSYALGSVTDVVYNFIAAVPIPQIGPVITLIPITAIYYSIKHFGIMKPTSVNHNELILTDETRTRLYFYLSLFYFAMGLLNFSTRYLPYTMNTTIDTRSSLSLSILFVAVGILITLFNQLKTEDSKYALNMVVVLFSIPLFALLFSSDSVLWVLPFILIILTLVFNHRIFLISVVFCSILTQILLFIYSQHIGTFYSLDDLLLRIGLYFIAGCLGYYVNRIYLQKLRAISYQIGFQKMLTVISFDFVNISHGNMDEKINHLLIQVGAFF